ncbi:MAG: hypothetical protein ACI9R3_001220 [Verrucomicrobiales bacterium]|jgi:hypothetical protein
MKNFGSCTANGPPNHVPFHYTFLMINTKRITALFAATLIAASFTFAAEQLAHWSLDEATDGVVPDSTGNHPAVAEDTLEKSSGAVAGSILFDGRSDALVVKDAAEFSFPEATFSITVWVNAHATHKGEQMIVGKNHYRANEREWGLLLDAESCTPFNPRAASGLNLGLD